MCRGRESDDRQCAQMGAAQTRFQPADQRLIGQQCVQVHRRLGDADALALRRDGRMEIG